MPLKTVSTAQREPMESLVERAQNIDSEESDLPSVEEVALQLFNAIKEHQTEGRQAGGLLETHNNQQEQDSDQSVTVLREITSFPGDLLEQIISFCPANSKFQCLKTSKRFRMIAERCLVNEISEFIKKDPHFKRWEFKSLKDLELVKQLHINFADIKEIPSSIALLKNLKSLELIGNQITELPETLQYLPRLAVMNLDNNQIAAYPSVLSKMKNIQVHVHGNLLPREISIPLGSKVQLIGRNHPMTGL